MQEDIINPNEEGQFDFDSAPIEAETQPDSEVSVPATEEKPAESEPQASDEEMWEYIYKGESVQVPKSKAQNILQQAHVLDEKFATFNKSQEDFNAKQAEAQGIIDRYQKIDQFAMENPEWFNEVQTAYEQKMARQGLPADLDMDDPMAQANLALKKEITDLKGELSQFKQEHELVKQGEADEQQKALLKQQVDDLRGEFKDVNFDAKDEHGISVENQVIKHALENDMDYKTAFLSKMYPILLKAAEERGAKGAAESVQKKRELGIVSSGTTPRVKQAKSVDTTKSWEEIAQDTINEYGG